MVAASVLSPWRPRRPVSLSAGGSDEPSIFPLSARTCQRAGLGEKRLAALAGATGIRRFQCREYFRNKNGIFGRVKGTNSAVNVQVLFDTLSCFVWEREVDNFLEIVPIVICYSWPPNFAPISIEKNSLAMKSGTVHRMALSRSIRDQNFGKIIDVGLH